MARDPRILGVEAVFSINGSGTIGYSYEKEWGQAHTPLIKMSLKWTKGLNVRPGTMKLLEENLRIKLLEMGLGHNFFGYDNLKHKQ